MGKKIYILLSVVIFLAFNNANAKNINKGKCTEAIEIKNVFEEAKEITEGETYEENRNSCGSYKTLNIYSCFKNKKISMYINDCEAHSYYNDNIDREYTDNIDIYRNSSGVAIRTKKYTAHTRVSLRQELLCIAEAQLKRYTKKCIDMSLI
jgi:hypothetical protein